MKSFIKECMPTDYNIHIYTKLYIRNIIFVLYVYIMCAIDCSYELSNI